MTQPPPPDTAADAVRGKDVMRPGWQRVALAIGHRWPIWLALTWAAISLYDFQSGLEYVILFVLPAAGYLFLAVVDRPRITWAVVLAATGTVTALRVLAIDPWPPLAVVAVALAAAGLLTGPLRRPGIYALQMPGALAFVTFGIVVLGLPATIGGYLVAVGLWGHAAWDAVHWHANKIVSRSFAEWCGVLDLVLGLGILALTIASHVGT
jgi:hypothetical protein